MGAALRENRSSVVPNSMWFHLKDVPENLMQIDGIQQAQVGFAR